MLQLKSSPYYGVHITRHYSQVTDIVGLKYDSLCDIVRYNRIGILDLQLSKYIKSTG